MTTTPASQSCSHGVVVNRLSSRTMALAYCPRNCKSSVSKILAKSPNGARRLDANERKCCTKPCLLAFLEGVRRETCAHDLLLNLDFSLLKPMFSAVWGQSVRKRNNFQHASGQSLTLNSGCMRLEKMCRLSSSPMPASKNQPSWPGSSVSSLA